MRRHLTAIAKALSLCTTIILILSGCSGAGSLGAGENTINIAMVANAQMTDAEKLATEFQAANPEIEAAVHHAVGEPVTGEDHHVDRDGR